MTNRKHADLEFGQWVNQYGGPAYECGFAIMTTSDDMIEENYRERLEEEGKEFTGWTDEDSDRITNAAMQLESNAMKYLRKQFSGARDDGHDSYGDLIGAVWLVLDGSEKSKNAAQLFLSAGGSSSERLRDWGLHEGIYDGIADDILEHSVDVEINFFGIEPDEEEMLLRYVETGEVPVDPAAPPPAPAPRRRRSKGASTQRGRSTASTTTTTRRSRAATKEKSMQTRTASIRVATQMLRQIARTGQFVYKGWLYVADAEKTQTSTPNRPDAEDAAPFIDDTYDTRSSDKPPKMDDLDFAKNKKVTFKAPGDEAAAPFIEDTPAEYASEKPKPVKSARFHTRRSLSTIR
jgi:hypothetical protein